jgi:hypothetical protein
VAAATALKDGPRGKRVNFLKNKIFLVERPHGVQHVERRGKRVFPV